MGTFSEHECCRRFGPEPDRFRLPKKGGRCRTTKNTPPLWWELIVSRAGTRQWIGSSAAGNSLPGDFADAQLRASQAAILEQEIAGIDVITGGEMHRRSHNRHSPPNAMLNHFWHGVARCRRTGQHSRRSTCFFRPSLQPSSFKRSLNAASRCRGFGMALKVSLAGVHPAQHNSDRAASSRRVASKLTNLSSWIMPGTSQSRKREELRSTALTRAHADAPANQAFTSFPILANALGESLLARQWRPWSSRQGRDGMGKQPDRFALCPRRRPLPGLDQMVRFQFSTIT